VEVVVAPVQGLCAALKSVIIIHLSSPADRHISYTFAEIAAHIYLDSPSSPNLFLETSPIIP
jgi:hypothetical protein